MRVCEHCDGTYLRYGNPGCEECRLQKRCCHCAGSGEDLFAPEDDSDGKGTAINPRWRHPWMKFAS